MLDHCFEEEGDVAVVDMMAVLVVDEEGEGMVQFQSQEVLVVYDWWMEYPLRHHSPQHSHHMADYLSTANIEKEGGYMNNIRIAH